MKIAAVVIVYNPDKNVVSNILSYSRYVSTVIVIDNSETNSDIEHDLKRIKNCLYLSDWVNRGVAERLNQACHYAIDNGFDWLLTMDQDSAFEGKNINSYLRCVDTYNKKDGVAMFGVTYDFDIQTSNACEVKDVSHLITSGSIINLKLFVQIGSFDENLFIDQVDFEYCYRAISRGFAIKQYQNIFLTHELGATSVHRSFLSFKKTTRSLHSPERIYYMTRNYLYIKAKYKKDFAKEMAHSKKDLLNRIKNNLFYNKKRTAVAQAILQGFLDYRKGRMGKR